MSSVVNNVGAADAAQYQSHTMGFPPPSHRGSVSHGRRAATRALSSATAGSESWAGRGGRAGGHLRGARAAAHRRVRAGRLAGTGHRGLSNNLITYQSPAAPLAERTSLFYPSRELPTAQCRYVPCLVSPLTARTLVTQLTVTHPTTQGFHFGPTLFGCPN